MNSIHKRALKLAHEDSHNLDLQYFLPTNQSLSVHQKNLQLLATEIFIFKIGISPKLINDINFMEKP